MTNVVFLPVKLVLGIAMSQELPPYIESPHLILTSTCELPADLLIVWRMGINNLRHTVMTAKSQIQRHVTIDVQKKVSLYLKILLKPP